MAWITKKIEGNCISIRIPYRNNSKEKSEKENQKKDRNGFSVFRQKFRSVLLSGLFFFKVWIKKDSVVTILILGLFYANISDIRKNTTLYPMLPFLRS